MKQTIEFKPGEESQVKLVLNASGYFSTLWNTLEHLRSMLKHGSHPDIVDDALEEVRSFIYQELASNNVSMDDIE